MWRWQKKLNNKENQMTKELWLAEQLFSEFSTLFHNFPATRIFPLSNQMNQHPDTHLFVGQNENFQGHQIITEQEFFSGKTFSFAIFVCFVYEICVYRKKHGKKSYSHRQLLNLRFTIGHLFSHECVKQSQFCLFLLVSSVRVFNRAPVWL